MQSSLIRPGLLVSLKTSLCGGVSYAVNTLDPDHAEGDARVARWETQRTIVNAEEHARATVARGKVRSLIRGVCIESAFGLLCPMTKQDALSEAIDEARALVNKHNGAAEFTRIEFYVLTGRVADDDQSAAAAIASEVRGLLDAMETAVKAADPEAIRAAANKARSMAGMLSEGAAKQVGAAVEEVRRIARKIVKEAEVSAEQAAAVVTDAKLDALKAARFAVLDLSPEGAETTMAAAAPAAGPGRALDLLPEAQDSAADETAQDPAESPAGAPIAPAEVPTQPDAPASAQNGTESPAIDLDAPDDIAALFFPAAASATVRQPLEV